MATAFVGREGVLGQLDQALADAATGAGCVALIYGEAGIGKTRLCQQLQDAHRQRGGQVLLGRGSPEESAIAYGAIADTLRFARRAEPQVWESARTRAGVLRAVTPEIGSAHQPGGGADRLLLFEATFAVAPQDAGVASATLNTGQQVGGSIGTSLLNTIFASSVAGYLTSHLSPATLVHGHPAPSLAGMSLIHGYTTGFWAAAAIFAAGAVISGTLFRFGPLRAPGSAKAAPARAAVQQPSETPVMHI